MGKEADAREARAQAVARSKTMNMHIAHSILLLAVASPFVLAKYDQLTAWNAALSFGVLLMSTRLLPKAPKGADGGSSSGAGLSPESTSKLIAKRRSVFPKDYNSVPVDKSVIEAMLEAANWAPTHGRTEPWRFIVYTGKGLGRLAQFNGDYYKKTTEAEKFDEKKYQKKMKSPKQASHVIAICYERLGHRKDKNILETEEIEATACAVQNMHLLATAYGVGAYWSSGGTVYSQEMREFLGLKEDWHCLGLFYIGNTDIYDSYRGARTPIQDKVQWLEE